MSDVNSTLQERGKRYGEFHNQATYAQDIKRVFQRSPNWETMTDDQREGLELIANKLGRILNGDPNYTDSWHDIAGYAQLVEKRIEQLAQEEELTRYNERVVGYLDYLIDNPTEHGDFDPIHDTPIRWFTTEEAEGQAFCTEAIQEAYR